MSDTRSKRLEQVAEWAAYVIIFGAVTLFVMGVIAVGSWVF